MGDVVLDAGVATGDYPRGYAVTVSVDGTHWSTAVGAGAGSGQFTTVDLHATPDGEPLYRSLGFTEPTDRALTLRFR